MRCMPLSWILILSGQEVWTVEALAQAFGVEWRQWAAKGVQQPPTEKMIELAKKAFKLQQFEGLFLM